MRSHHPKIVVRNRKGVLVSYLTIERIVQATTIDQVLELFNEIEVGRTEGLCAVGFIAYDAAPAFDAAYRVNAFDGHEMYDHCGDLSNLPLAWFALCCDPVPLAEQNLQEVDTFVSPPDWTDSVTKHEYVDAIATIRQKISNGSTYQVNYTFKRKSPFIDDPFKFFLQTTGAEKGSIFTGSNTTETPYATYLDTGRFVISSASPELFFERSGERLTMRPMKGTAARGLSVMEDDQFGENLRTSDKNRAENLMIVDMIRNDVGRIATTGSVVVEKLFELERYPTLWQMTSTVTAKTNATLIEIFTALFPCSSITGAPKVETMQIISEVEESSRGLYTGAIGVVYPDGDARFSVAIRTALFDRQKQSLEYGVGSGIVWDSTAEDEYLECQLKTEIVSRPALERFSLLETLRFDQDAVVGSNFVSGIWLIDEHLARLESSASYFNYPFSRQLLLSSLNDEVSVLVGVHRLRLLLEEDGTINIESSPIYRSELDCDAVVAIIDESLDDLVDESDMFLYHKTTNRSVYNYYLDKYSQYDDVVLINSRGELTEGCLHNLIVRIEGVDYTPPVSSGLLAGTHRAKLLSEGSLVERILYPEDIKRAESVKLINSVRGVRAVNMKQSKMN